MLSVIKYWVSWRMLIFMIRFRRMKLSCFACSLILVQSSNLTENFFCNFTNPNPKSDKFEFDHFLLLVQSLHLTKKYFDNFSYSNPKSEQFELCTKARKRFFGLTLAMRAIKSTRHPYSILYYLCHFLENCFVWKISPVNRLESLEIRLFPFFWC